MFDEARRRLARRTLHFGYAGSRGEYAKWLRRGDIAVSTSMHEFFGVSVLEAVRAGCRPLLPARLSYPEIFPAEYLYDDADLTPRLKVEISAGNRLSTDESRRLTEPYSWDALAPEYEAWISGAPGA